MCVLYVRSCAILLTQCAIYCMQELAVKLDTVVEPSFIALGPFHMAVGINDRSWIYEIRDHGRYMTTTSKTDTMGTN